MDRRSGFFPGAGAKRERMSWPASFLKWTRRPDSSCESSVCCQTSDTHCNSLNKPYLGSAHGGRGGTAMSSLTRVSLRLGIVGLLVAISPGCSLRSRTEVPVPSVDRLSESERVAHVLSRL